MAGESAKQEGFGAVVMSFGSVFVAAMEWMDRPAPGEFEEMGPDWYMNFSTLLHGAILVLLLLALVRLPSMMADKPGLRTPFLAMILVGIAAAAYVVGIDLGMI